MLVATGAGAGGATTDRQPSQVARPPSPLTTVTSRVPRPASGATSNVTRTDVGDRACASVTVTPSPSSARTGPGRNPEPDNVATVPSAPRGAENDVADSVGAALTVKHS